MVLFLFHGWIVGFANPVTQLDPRENQTVKLGIIPPINQDVTDSAFKISISVTATNGDRQTMKQLFGTGYQNLLSVI